VSDRQLTDDPTRVDAVDLSAPAWSISEEVRAIVDEFAEELDRSIVVEDSRMRLIAFSPHLGQIDPIRERSLLTRETPGEAIRWLSDLGIFESTTPTRVAARPEIGAEARVMSPIRWQENLVGFLAILDPDSSLTDAELERCQATSERLALLLHRMVLLHQGVRPRERELVDMLLTAEEPLTRTQAGTTLVEEGYLKDGRSVVIVVEPAGSGARTPTEHEVLLSQAVVRVKRTVPQGAIACTTRAQHCTLVISLDARSDPEAEAARMALQVHGCLTAIADPRSAGRAALLTYGAPVEEWANAGLAYRQAVLAARAARKITSLGSVVGWSQLGIYQTLSLIPTEELGTSDTDHRLATLVSKPDLLLTLETYLDVAGDVKRAAEQLNLHRASLYYRLQRIEETLGMDLKRGEDRLMLHVALKALRLRSPRG
jgi:sugar diacid utilization regulator